MIASLGDVKGTLTALKIKLLKNISDGDNGKLFWLKRTEIYNPKVPEARSPI
jgi:hypothetical protein